MPNPSVTVDGLQPLQIRLKLASQITFDRQFAGRDRMNDVVQLLRSKILRPSRGIDARLLKNLFSSAQSDAVDIRKGRFNAFVAGDFHSK